MGFKVQKALAETCRCSSVLHHACCRSQSLFTLMVIIYTVDGRVDHERACMFAVHMCRCYYLHVKTRTCSKTSRNINQRWLLITALFVLTFHHSHSSCHQWGVSIRDMVQFYKAQTNRTEDRPQNTAQVFLCRWDQALTFTETSMDLNKPRLLFWNFTDMKHLPSVIGRELRLSRPLFTVHSWKPLEEWVDLARSEERPH